MQLFFYACWEHHGILLEALEEDLGEREVCMSLLRLLPPPRSGWIDDRRWMDGWMDRLSFSLSCWLLCYMLPSAYIGNVIQPAEILRILAGFQHILAENSVYH